MCVCGYTYIYIQKAQQYMGSTIHGFNNTWSFIRFLATSIWIYTWFYTASVHPTGANEKYIVCTDVTNNNNNNVLNT